MVRSSMDDPVYIRPHRKDAVGEAPHGRQPASLSTFLTEPAATTRSRWKLSTGEAINSLSSAAEPPSPPPPLPAKPSASSSFRRPARHESPKPQLPPKMNRWKSFGVSVRLISQIPSLIPLFGVEHAVVCCFCLGSPGLCGPEFNLQQWRLG